MEALFALSIAFAGFGLLIVATYIPFCYWLWLDYRRRLHGRKSFWRYLEEHC